MVSLRGIFKAFFNWIHFSLFWGRTHFVSLIYHFIPRHTLGEIVNYLLPFIVYLRTFARKFSNIDFFLRLLPLKVDDLLMSEM